MHSEIIGSTSRSLLRRAREHDSAAWEKLSAVYSPLVYHWCRRAGLKTHDAADVVQEVFRAVSCALGEFRKERSEDTFRGWLWTITRNKIRDHFRARADRPDAAGGSSAQQRLAQLPAEVPSDIDESTAQRMHARLTRRAVSLMQTDFAESTWQAFWMTAVENLPAASVAEQLGLSVAAIYMAKSRVLRHLRQELEGLDLMD